MAGTNVISLELEDFVQGGLVNDVDVEVTEIQFCGWDYDGKVNTDILAVKATLAILDDHGRPDPNAIVDQYWSAGGEFAQVGLSDDGYTLLPGQNKSALTKGSNLELLLSSMRAHGLPKGYLADGNIGKLKGMRMHVIRQATKREGFSGRGATAGDREPSVLVCSKILSGPWEKGAGAGAATRGTTNRVSAAVNKANGAAPAAQAQPSAPAADSDTEAVAVASVTAALQAVEGNMFPTVKDLKVAVFRRHAKDKADTRNLIVKLVEDTAWLEAHGFGVMDGAVLLGA